MKKSLLILLSILISTSVFAQDIADSIQKEIIRRVDANINPGIAIAVFYPDESIKYINYGVTAIGGSQPVNEHTIFEIGSITKTFTASMVLDNVEEIDLDESFLSYLPAVHNESLASITVIDLLNHKSGLPRLSEEFDPADWSNPFSDYSREKLTAELNTVKPVTTPSWSYSNLGYATLGRIIENATNQEKSTLFNHLFSKIGISGSYINRRDVPQGRLAQPTYLGIPFSYWDFAGGSGYAGTIKSSSADLIKYLKYNKDQNQLFNSGKIVSPFETKLGAYGENQLSFKNGWFIFKPDETTEIVTHNGGTGGFSSFIAYNNNTETGIVILTNSLSPLDDIGLKMIYPAFKLKQPKKSIAYEFSQMVKEGKVEEIYDLFLTNKESGEYPVDIMQIYWLERYCFGQGLYKYSNELARILVDLLPEDWEVYDLKGQNMEKLGDLEGALANYKKAKHLNPNNMGLEKRIQRCAKK